MISRCFMAICCFSLLLVSLASAKHKEESSKPAIVVLWPNATSPTLRISFQRFTQLASYNGQLSLGSDVLVENLSGKAITQASFTVYLTDKDKVRVGTGNLTVNDLDPAQQAKLAFQVFSTGIPVNLSLVARSGADGIPSSLRRLPTKVISVPPGASLKVDGQDVGFTPITVDLAVGHHILAFSKKGFASGSTPMDIKADDAPGGSITFTLGGLSQDELELRDGSVLQGDAISLSMTSIVFRINGVDQSYDRNQVREITLVQRETTAQPPVVVPTQAQPSPKP